MTYLKKQTQWRDLQLWEVSLRMTEVETHLQRQTKSYNSLNIKDDAKEVYGLYNVQKELNSKEQVIKLL